jgi:DNA-binding transcriptional ArsR family regulator
MSRSEARGCESAAYSRVAALGKAPASPLRLAILEPLAARRVAVRA